MIVKVRMCAFREGEIREVTIPDGVEPGLETAFHYGQNDFQPLPFPSVSVGDVIEWEGLHLILAFGFKEITEEYYTNYMSKNRQDRNALAYMGE